jgi:hypothetical protein
MTPQRKVFVAAVCSFIAGGLLVGVAGSVGFARYIKNEQASSYYAHAAQAQFEVRTLSRLRAGNLEKVVSDLELMLNGDTIQFAAYENVVAPAQRDPFVYRTLAEVRDYRSKFPAHFAYPLQEAEFEKALALGKKAGG